MSELKEPAFLRVRFYTTLPAVLLLLSVLGYGTASLLHGQLLQLGEHVWPGYHALRDEPEAPACDPATLRTERDATLTATPAPGGGGAVDPLDRLLEDGAGAAPGSAEAPGTAAPGTASPGAAAPEGVDLDDLLDEAAVGPAPSEAAPAPGNTPAPGEAVPAPGSTPTSGEANAAPGEAIAAPGEATPTPDEGTPTPDEGTPTPDEGTPTPGEGTPAPGADAPAPTGGPSADAGELDLDDLLADTAPPPAVAPPADDAAAADDDKPDLWYAIDGKLAECEQAHAAFSDAKSRRTDWLKRYRVIESTVETFNRIGVEALSHVLALLLLICAVATTVFKHHIALRPPRARIDHLFCDGAQLVANGLLLYSVWQFRAFDVDAFGNPQHDTLHLIWIAGFAALCVANVYNLVRPPPVLAPGAGLLRALLSVPLYAMMALIAGGYFMLIESHPAGLAIYIAKLTEHALLYLNIGLYVWVGMLLKRTKLANLCFDALRPWRLAPELLAFVAVVGAALPTAYSGASGIFVIAAGAVIYRELRKAGARRQLSLAATAMSGSMGVVLSPCLLVVIVASLNGEVVTDQLYSWGNRVFLLTAVLFLVVAMATRQGPLTWAKPREALPGTVAALRQLVPYVLLFVVLLVVYRYTLDAKLDEHSAPVILPLLMIGVLLYDRLTRREVVNRSGRVVRFGFRKALAAATSETTGHIGALLMLMGLSVCLGGIIERAELMELMPASLGSVWTAMGVLVVVLVVIGMTMDPYGAVVLVSATIAEVAYRNGIDPVHFWMVVLVAFELGYLTPPVALNHLLTRQVVGDARVERAENEPGGVWARNERYLLPIVVMGTALLLVAFVPLMTSGYGKVSASDAAPVSSSASP